MSGALASVHFHHDSSGRAIADDVVVAESVYLGNNVTLYPKVRLGDEAIVMDGAVLGRIPIPNRTVNRPVSDDYSDLSIGAGSIIGCNAVLYTGSQIGRNVLVADLASIREGCDIGDGAVIGRGVMLLYACRIGRNSRIQDQVHIAGKTIVEEDVFIGMGVTTTNDNDIYLTRFGLSEPNIQGPIIRKYAVVAAGATLLPGIEIGQGAFISAGAVVTRDVPAWTVVAGVPARVTREVPGEWRREIELRAAK